MKPRSISDTEFEQEVLGADQPVLVDFWADWCGPCKMIAPMIDEFAVEYEGRLKVMKMDVDKNPRIAMQYGIRSIPTLMIFKDGKIVEQIIGAVPKRSLEEKITPHLN